MHKIIVGADVSGNVCPRGQAMYIALVFGTPESIEKSYRRIGIPSIHMSLLGKSKRRIIIQNLDLSDKDLVVVCLHVQKQGIIEEILSDPRFQARNMPKVKLYRHFDYLLFRKIRDTIESFAFPRRCDLDDIIMQCDSDMVRTGTNWKMHTVDRGKAYEIADVVAWCNMHDIQINQCKDIDLASQIRMEMRHDLLK